MVDRLFPNKKRHLEVLLHRVGQEVHVFRPDGTATANRYGKVEDVDISYTRVGYGAYEYGQQAYSGEPIYARRLYGGYDDRPGENNEVGGHVNIDSPRIAFSSDVDVQEDDRVEFVAEGVTYLLERKVPRETHNEFRAVLVNE